jgi:hypothetical protein
VKHSPISAALGAVLALAQANAGAADSMLPEVRPVDLAKMSPADFSDEDLDLPYDLSGPGEGDLADTAFASKCVGEALILPPASGPPIDPSLWAQAGPPPFRAHRPPFWESTSLW